MSRFSERLQAGTNYTNEKFVKNVEDGEVAKPIVLLRNRVEELSAYAVYRITFGSLEVIGFN